MSYISVSRLRNLLSGFARSGKAAHSGEHIFALRRHLFLTHLWINQPRCLLSVMLRSDSRNRLWTKNRSALSPFCRTCNLSMAFQPKDDGEEDEAESDSETEEEDEKSEWKIKLRTFLSKYLSWYMLPVGMAMCATLFLLNEYQASAPEIDLPTLLKQLDHGEIRELYVAYTRAYVYYHAETQKPPHMIRISIPVLRNAIRMEEARWGIAEEHRLPIIVGIPPELTLDNLKRKITPVQMYYIFGRFVASMLITMGSFAIHITLIHPRSAIIRAKSGEIGKNISGMKFSGKLKGVKIITRYKPVKTNVRFSDIAGMHASKEEVMEYVTIMRNPKRFGILGAKLPKGALLVGPSGTGKTLLVKALANESSVPFYSVAGPEFIEVYAGLGASRMRALFQAAREHAPSIIFIDEVDSVGCKRPGTYSESPYGSDATQYPPGVDEERAQVLNQLLVEMDGMNSSQQVLVFAATNRVNTLDRALLRPGRFDRHIYVDLPNQAERKEILDLYIGKCRLSPSVRRSDLIVHLAYSTAGMSGADLCNICNEAALSAVRQDKDAEYVSWEDFEVALERVVAGVAKQINPLTSADRRVAAVKEAGRTMIAWLLPHAGLIPIKASIVPRIVTTVNKNFGNLGFTQFIPDDRRICTSDELEDQMAVLLGGRAAEQILCNAVSDASRRDLSEAFQMALRHVREYGMSKTLGHLSFEENDPYFRPYSEYTQKLIELEAQRLVLSVYKRCVNLLTDHRQHLEALVAALIEKETLNSDELMQLFMKLHKAKL